ncbi:MAG: glycosyltransferase [Sulfurovum sp.]|nr:glycosyltransferase [Sulfurovum sp.]
MPTEQYYKALQSYDINLAPLESSVFNDAKSNIKYLEASILGLPTVASDVAEYHSSIIQGMTGFIAQDTASWIDKLEQLIEDKNLRENIAKNAYDAVIKDYSLHSIAHKSMQPLLDTYIQKPASNTKHILMANVLYKPISFGGATIVIEELSTRINQKEGYDVTVFTGFFDEHYDLPRPYDIVRYEVNEVSVILLRFPFPLSKTQDYRNEQIQTVFDEILLSLEPDLVHFHSIQQLSASIAKPCITHNIPYVITLHDMWWLCEKQFMIKPDNTYCYQSKIDTNYCITQCTHNQEATQERTKYLKAILDDASLLLTPSTFQAQMYGYNIADTRKIKVNKNAIIFPSSSYSKQANQNIRFAYLGGHAVHKGYDMIKEIFESLETSNYELIVVDLHRKLGHNSIIESDWNLQGKLTLSDGYHYSQKGLDDFFASIDVLLFPSQWKESFGLTIREALVRDVWVISTDAGGVVEDIVEGENGNILAIGDNEGYKNIIEDAIKNNAKFNKYENPHKNNIRAYDAQVEELLGYYDEVWTSK